MGAPKKDLAMVAFAFGFVLLFAGIGLSSFDVGLTRFSTIIVAAILGNMYLTDKAAERKAHANVCDWCGGVLTDSLYLCDRFERVFCSQQCYNEYRARAMA